MTTSTRQNRSAPAREAGKESPVLTPSRPFGTGGAHAPGADAARLGHDFGSVAVQRRSRNDTGLPDDLKTGIEHLSGLPLDDVKVHYNSPRPATLQAHAYTQGTAIHVAPGQERHLAHEAWHVVQQKQGRVRPTLRLRGAEINDSDGLEREADAMGAKARQARAAPAHSVEGAGAAEGASGAGAGGVVQRFGMPDWLTGLFSKKEEQPLLGRQRNQSYQHLVFQSDHDAPEVMRRNEEHAQNASASSVPEKTSLGITAANLLGKSGDIAKLTGVRGGIEAGSITGAVGPALTTVGSLVDAGVNVHDLATGGQQTGDKLETASQLTSNLGNATANAALATHQGAALLGHPLSGAATTTLGHVAAPAAIAMGAADILGGGFGAYRAGKRQKALEGIASPGEDAPLDLDRGLAEFAGEQQKTKKWSNVGRVAKGGLALGGGIALAAAGLSNPIGWGLLGGAALVGGGIAAYKAYRQYQQGKRLLHDDAYRTRLGLSGVQLPERGAYDNDWFGKRWWNTYKAHDSVRGHVANQLAPDGITGSATKEQIRKNIGIKERPWEERNEVSTTEQKEKRARQIARSLKT